MDKTYLGRSLESFAPGIESQPITKVELLDENGDVVGVSGADTGRTLTALQPDGTDAMAAAILAKVGGYAHRGYEGRGALLDPAAELGDAVTVDGLYVPLIALDTTFDALLSPDISSPDADEIDDEYPYKSPTQRQIERNMAKARSLITKTSEAITLRVDGLEEDYTALQVTVDGVTITDESGTTKIKGSSIETSTLYVDAAHITGTLVIGQLPSGVAQTSQIPTDTSQLTNSAGYQTAQGVTTIINGVVTTDYIYALGVEASTLRGSTIALKDLYGNTVGGFTLAYTSTGDGLGMSTVAGGINISSAANVYITSAYRNRLQLDSQAAKIGPTVWATDGTVIYSSDRNVKNSIEYDLSGYRQFLLDLKPCRFKYNEGQSDRFHVGLIAQDVERSLADNGLDPKDFAGWCKMENLDAKGTYTYGIRYDDIVPLNTMMIQELVRRVTALEEGS